MAKCSQGLSTGGIHTIENEGRGRKRKRAEKRKEARIEREQGPCKRYSSRQLVFQRHVHPLSTLLSLKKSKRTDETA